MISFLLILRDLGAGKWSSFAYYLPEVATANLEGLHGQLCTRESYCLLPTALALSWGNVASWSPSCMKCCENSTCYTVSDTV